jgi:hypothetical protein
MSITAAFLGCVIAFFWMGEYRKFFKSSILSFYTSDKSQYNNQLIEIKKPTSRINAFSIRVSVYI